MMRNSGRVYGEANGQAKLTDAQVRAIRGARFLNGDALDDMGLNRHAELATRLAERYGVTPTQIRRIWHGTTRTRAA